jgi:hypothetical protein
MSFETAQIVPFPSRRAPLLGKRRAALARFKNALDKLSDRPTTDNAFRYLEASHALDESRGVVRSLPKLRQNAGELPPAA